MEKEKINWKSFGAGAVVLIIGMALVLVDALWKRTELHIFVSIGCSLIASGTAVILTALFFERRKTDPMEGSGANRVYMTRGEMNADCEKAMKKCKYAIDVIGFGQKTFRSKQTPLVRKMLERGVNFRFITMDPDFPFVEERERAEKEVSGQIKKTIHDLVKWADELNAAGYKGKIIVKGHNTMTLEFFWRVDNALFLGPYWYGLDSQETISYQYGTGSVSGTYFRYFDDLWSDEDLMRTLTK